MTILTLPASHWSSLVLFAIVPVIGTAALLALTRLYTTWRCQRALKQFSQSLSGPGKTTLDPPQIPYSVPFLGSGLTFLNDKAGKYWNDLFQWYPRSTGACTLLLGGRRAHILFSPTAVAALFKDRKMAREAMEAELLTNVFGMDQQDVNAATSTKQNEHEMNTKYLIKYERVNELTDTFNNVLDQVLSKDTEEMVASDGFGLYHWLRDRMFTASTTALMGDKLLQMYPSYCDEYYDFDQNFIGLFFALPKFTMRGAHEHRDQIIAKLEFWSSQMIAESGGSPTDPEGPAWEPVLGSRLNRARQVSHKQRGLSPRAGAALDLGITLALASNVVPATGWMLMNLLNPDGDASLLPRVLAEIKKATNPDGTLDVPTLIAMPLLQSLWTETLRLYTDVLVFRDVKEDIALPLDEDGKRLIMLRKGDNVFCPSWLGHQDADAWSRDEAPIDQWYPDRFLVPDPDKPGEMMFTMASTTGKFFPFGGGRTICPGRTFAKQEAIGAVAMILLRFDFEVLGYLDKNGKDSQAFPSLASAFPGSGGLVPGGDFKVKLRRRETLE